jgi:murein DD-endopeptidase MepM/ murein hydrolase activator NlpD
MGAGSRRRGSSGAVGGARCPRQGRGRHVVMGALLALVLVAMPGAAAARPVPAAGDALGRRVRPDAVAKADVRYIPPVTGTVIDPFRAPTTPYGPGNRGIDYETAPLSPVVASAPGEVLFAGQVAGALHITVRHPDGLRTSYSFVAELRVHAGQRVAQGQVIGLTGELFHFGVRDPAGTYLDPALLFTQAVEVHLVPSGDDGAPPVLAVAAEPAALSSVVTDRLGPISRWFSQRARRAVSPADVLHRLRAFAHYASELRVETHALRLARGLDQWADRGHDCTPPAEPATRPPGRRILVEVAGIGSTSDRAAVADVDAAGLGYDRRDVVRFSYRGGRVPAIADGSSFATIAPAPYDARDSQGDLRVAGAQLATLLEDVTRVAPGVPIDVVAHSQGGVVARLALADGERRGALPASVHTLVTLGSPHQGANAATAVDTIASDPRGAIVLEQVQQGLAIPLDPSLPAGRQLSQVSSLIDDVRAHPVPRSVHFTSVGARGDVVVPAGRTVTDDPGAHETILPLSGIHAHDRLPADAGATREIALAVAGRAPTCRSLAEVTADLTVSDLISWTEDESAIAAGRVVPGGPP